MIYTLLGIIFLLFFQVTIVSKLYAETDKKIYNILKIAFMFIMSVLVVVTIFMFMGELQVFESILEKASLYYIDDSDIFRKHR